jgi:hypothetical protein
MKLTLLLEVGICYCNSHLKYYPLLLASGVQSTIRVKTFMGWKRVLYKTPKKTTVFLLFAGVKHDEVFYGIF